MVAGNSGNIVYCTDINNVSIVSQTFKRSKFVQMNAPRGTKSHSTKVALVNEGAGGAVALLGLFRLVYYLSQDHLLGRKRAFNCVLDSSTGTTAVGLGLGAVSRHSMAAIVTAAAAVAFSQASMEDYCNDGIVHWLDRCHPRKFSKILEGEIDACQQIAQQTGILVDPVYTLVDREMATRITSAHEDANVVMLHIGSTLVMFGLAQRYKSSFGMLNNIIKS
ncbi:hypothetical protein CRYUN_Cryun04dG0152400 [Craigia yunnanensis]